MQSKFVSGEAGDLEALIDDTAGKHMAVLSHPHPSYGGSMHDGVLSTLSEAFNRLGVSTTRFNFRGVGRSQGQYSGTEEWQDVLSVASYCSRQMMAFKQHSSASHDNSSSDKSSSDNSNPDNSSSDGSIYLCGYSFGAGMTYQALGQLKSFYPELGAQVRGCLLIAPPLQMLPAPVTPPPCRTQVIVGERDHVVAAQDLTHYFGSENVTVVGHADHFFQGAQDNIYKSVEELISGS
jgi:alpha/beta superfamily hydrolase